MGISCKANSSGQLVTASDFMKSSTSSCAAELQCPASKKKSSVKKKLELFKYKDLEAATGGFAEANRIGTSSCHGELYKGRLSDGRVVTVKRPSTSSTLELAAAGRRRSTLWQQDEDAFENEVEILTKVFSRRLVNLLGYNQDAAGKVKLLVVEFMENASLHSQLHTKSSSDVEKHHSRPAPPSTTTLLSWPLRVHLALQTAKALRALHSSSPPIVHRNIRAMNVFIDRNWNARLGEFGFARHVLQDTEEDLLVAAAAAAVPSPRKTHLSSIPESMSCEPAAESCCDHKSNCRSCTADQCSASSSSNGSAATVFRTLETDVLSFGVLLLEIITGKNAMSQNPDCSLSSLIDWALPLIKQGNTLAICDPRIRLPPLLCIPALNHMATIAARCLLRPTSTGRSSSSLKQQQQQPSMSEVVEVLTKVSKLIPLPLWNGPSTRVVKSCMPDQQTQPSSCFVIGLDTRALNCRIGRLIRLPLWVGFLKIKNKENSGSGNNSNKAVVKLAGQARKSISSSCNFIKLAGQGLQIHI
jgi:serine/threonine protein kinase